MTDTPTGRSGESPEQSETSSDRSDTASDRSDTTSDRSDTTSDRSDVPRRASFDETDFDGDASDGDTGTPPYRCDHCGRPFEREDWLTLHLGHAHPETLSDDEIERFRDAHEDEETKLGRFRLLALGALVLIYFGLLLLYALLAL